MRRCVRLLFTPANLISIETGKRFEEGWKLNYETPHTKSPQSLWHHVPSRVTTPSSPSSSSQQPLLWYVTEIPRGQREKLELSTKQAWNPIVQDRNKKTGSLRLFTYGDLPFHYGFLPQTWEDPTVVHKETKCVGDADPLDVVDVTPGTRAVGSIAQVKLLGVLALIDEGETDWKMIVVDARSEWTSLQDVPLATRDSIRNWFRFYKTTDGKPENAFAFDGEIRGEAAAWDVVEECEGQYQRLRQGSTANPGLWLPPPL